MWEGGRSREDLAERFDSCNASRGTSRSSGGEIGPSLDGQDRGDLPRASGQLNRFGNYPLTSRLVGAIIKADGLRSNIGES